MPVISSKVILAGLEPVILDELRHALRLLDVEVTTTGDSGADLVFCGTAQVEQLVRVYPDLPVIAVCGQRQITDWLDAMEAGAVDYCAAPFEATHLSWILQSNLRPTTRPAAQTSGSCSPISAAVAA